MIHKPRQRLQTLAVVLMKTFFLEGIPALEFDFSFKSFNFY
jgi:hypothetical protein